MSPSPWYGVESSLISLPIGRFEGGSSALPGSTRAWPYCSATWSSMVRPRRVCRLVESMYSSVSRVEIPSTSAWKASLSTCASRTARALTVATAAASSPSTTRTTSTSTRMKPSLERVEFIGQVERIMGPHHGGYDGAAFAGVRAGQRVQFQDHGRGQLRGGAQFWRPLLVQFAFGVEIEEAQVARRGQRQRQVVATFLQVQGRRARGTGHCPALRDRDSLAPEHRGERGGG